MIRGRVVEDTHEGADEHINKLAKKYMGLDEYPHRQPGEQRVIFKIKPEKIVTRILDNKKPWRGSLCPGRGFYCLSSKVDR